MRAARTGLTALAGLASAAAAQAPALGPQLAGLGFLVGQWQTGPGQAGQVAETGGRSTGRSTISIEAGGNVLLRRDHTDLLAADGKAAGSFEQVMMIYPEAGAIRADYSDGTHVIHYAAAEVVAGKAATFTSVPKASAPTFRLHYELAGPRTLAIRFEMAPPGGGTFAPIATGSLSRAD